MTDNDFKRMVIVSDEKFYRKFYRPEMTAIGIKAGINGFELPVLIVKKALDKLGIPAPRSNFN